MKVSPQVCSSHQFPPMQILSLCCKFMKLLKWLKTPPYTPPRQIEAFVGQIIPLGHGHGRGRTNTSQFSSHGRGFVQTGQNSSRPAAGYAHNAGEKSKKHHFQAKSQEGNHSETFKHPQAELCIECQICGKFGHGALKCWNIQSCFPSQ